MITSKDTVVAAMSATLYLALAVASSIFVAVPGFVYVYLPVIWNMTLPIWFGLFGVLGVFVGDVIYNAVFRGLGVLGVFSSFFTIAPLLIYWLAAPKGYGELRTKKHVAYLILSAVWVEALIIGGVLYFMVFIGILPVYLAWVAFWLALASNVPWMIPVTAALFRTLTPFIKKSGVYYGPYRE